MIMTTIVRIVVVFFFIAILIPCLYPMIFAFLAFFSIVCGRRRWKKPVVDWPYRPDALDQFQTLPFGRQYYVPRPRLRAAQAHLYHTSSVVPSSLVFFFVLAVFPAVSAGAFLLQR